VRVKRELVVESEEYVEALHEAARVCRPGAKGAEGGKEGKERGSRAR
jgi:hypothetical protein